MTAANLDSADLKAALSAPGLLREDLMDRIWEVDNIPLEFSDRCRKTSTDNSMPEWTTEELAAVDPANKVVDGADASGNNTKVGERLANHCQESVKVVRVSDRAQGSDGVGGINTLSHQLAQRQKELRRDVEAISLSMQASIADDGASVAGQTAGVFAWLKTNISAGATGTHAGYNSATKLVAAGTAGTKRALTETLLRTISMNMYKQTGEREDLIMMMSPEVQMQVSSYLYTSTARVATFTKDAQTSKNTAVGAVDAFKVDFGFLTMVSNILMPKTAANTSTVGILNFNYIEQCFLKNYYVKELARTGLADNRQIAVDWCVRVMNEKAEGAIFDVDEQAAMILT
jgi:hypothetical protein